MNKHLKVITNGYNLVIGTNQELRKLYCMDSGLSNLLVHKFNKGATNRIKLMHGWIIKELQVAKQLIHHFILQHKVVMCKNVKQRFELNHLLIPLSLGACWHVTKHNLNIFGHTTSCFSNAHNLLQFTPLSFFTPSYNKSWIIILWPTCFINLSHLHPTNLSLFSIKE